MADEERGSKGAAVQVEVTNVHVVDEIKKKSKFWRVSLDLMERGLVEFVGCMVFHFVGSVSPTAWANGIILIVLVYYTAKISGAHLNPAVSLTFCLLGHTTPGEMLVYWTAQIMGCAAGALWIAALVPGVHVRSDPTGEFQSLDGCFTPLPVLSSTRVFWWETMGTCSFIVPIFSVVWYTQNKKGYGNVGPFIVGMSLIANALAVGQFTGASFNPARSLGSPIVFNCPYDSHIYTYVLGELLCATFAIVLIIPWYGISREPWYAGIMPAWLFKASKHAEKSIVLETIQKVDKRPPHHALSLAGLGKAHRRLTNTGQPGDLPLVNGDRPSAQYPRQPHEI